MATRTARPIHLPITTSLRRSGRASIERRSPLSTSLEMSGPATTAALSARTPLYMNTMTIRSCELTSATWSGGSVSPRLLVTVVILLKPHAENPTTSSVRIRSARRSLRRSAAQQLIHRARGDDAPVVDHGHAVANLFHLTEQVRVEKHGCAPGRQAADDLAHVVPADRIERGGRLVEEDELRLSQQRGAEAEPLLHALGEGAHAIARAVTQPDGVDHGLDLVFPARARQRRELAVQREHLLGGEPALVPEKLGKVADVASSPEVADRLAEEPPLARSRPQQAEEELDGGGLAGAVGAEKTEHLAARHGHRETGQRDCTAEALGQLDGFDGGGGGGRARGG